MFAGIPLARKHLARSCDLTCSEDVWCEMKGDLYSVCEMLTSMDRLQRALLALWRKATTTDKLYHHYLNLWRRRELIMACNGGNEYLH